MSAVLTGGRSAFDNLTGRFKAGVDTTGWQLRSVDSMTPDGLTITGYFDDPQAVAGLTFFHELYQKQMSRQAGVDQLEDTLIDAAVSGRRKP